MTRRRIILAIVVIVGLAVLVTLLSIGKETKDPRLGVGLVPDRIAKSEFWVKVYVTNQSSQVVTFPPGGPYFLILPGAVSDYGSKDTNSPFYNPKGLQNLHSIWSDSNGTALSLSGIIQVQPGGVITATFFLPRTAKATHLEFEYSWPGNRMVKFLQPLVRRLVPLVRGSDKWIWLGRNGFLDGQYHRLYSTPWVTNTLPVESPGFGK
jgi:hypothetical protein